MKMRIASVRTQWAILALLSLLATPAPVQAVCSVIPPIGFDQIGFVGSLTSPFLAPDLTNDVKVVGAICDQENRSAASDFQVGGVDLPASAFVITIAFTPQDAVGLAHVLVLADDTTLCGADGACSVDALAQREIVEIPLPGGGVERRLRFKYPSGVAAVGPAQLAVRLATAAAPVAFELRDTACSEIALGTDVACLGQFFVQDGSCRKGDEFVNQPFSGLVALPRTAFTDICTEGCDDAPVSSTLPITTDRDGNALFGLIYEELLVRVDRGDGQIEPRPRRLRLGIADPVSNGFTDPDYAAKPSSFTEQGAGLAPPFNPANDPTGPADQFAIWGMVDAASGVILLPRQSCSDDPARACSADTDCSAAASCQAPEFSFLQDGQAVELPVAEALAQQAVELNSWLSGDRTDDAVGLVEDELLAGDPINQDLAADDRVVELLDRTTGLIKSLSGLFKGRGLTEVRVVDGEKDFVVSSIAAENDKLVFIESEMAEGLANPLGNTTQAEAVLADVNANGRLDQNLRLFQLPADKAAPEAESLLPDGLHVSVLPDLRFSGSKNVVLSEGHVFFAYSDLTRQAHTYQLVNQSSDGTPGNFFAGQADLASDGGSVVLTSGADNLFVPAPSGALVTETPKNTVVQALSSTGDFPEIVDGRSVFAWEAFDDGKGPLPSRFYVEIKLCDTAAGQPDLETLFNPDLSGPNVNIVAEPTSCAGCAFPGSLLASFDRGLGKGGSQIFTLVFDSPDIPAGEVGISFKTGGKADVSAIRGPVCLDPTLQGGVERVYLRDFEAGTTEIVSVNDRASCSEQPVASDDPSGNPGVTASGGLVFFDSKAALGDDDDATSDVYVYDAATCSVTNLTGSLLEPAANPTSSDDGSVVAFESGAEIFVLDRTTGDLQNLGTGMDADLSADGSKLVFTADVGGVFQVFLVDLGAGSTVPVPVSVEDGAGAGFLLAGGGAPSVANGAGTAFETPPGDVDSEILVRNVAENDTSAASTVGIGQNLCTFSPCGAMAPSISDDGRFVAFVLRGLLPFDEVVIKDLITGSLTPLSRMAGADDDSLDPSLGESGDFVALTSFASQLGGVAGAADPNVFLNGPVDPSADRRPLLGLIDLSTCGGGTLCAPILTGEPVTKGAVFEGDVGVVGSPVRVVEVGSGPGGFSVKAFGREGLDVALSGDYVCAVTTTDALGNPGEFAACAARGDSSLTDLTFGGAALPAESVGLCGARAITLGPDGVLYETNLDVGPEATAVGFAEDFSLGEGQDVNGDGRIDSCLVAFRTLETDLGGAPATVGNRDVDLDDLAMALLGIDSIVTDCQSSSADCPGEACELFDYQAGREAVLFIVNESHENFGGAACTVRRCTAAGSLTEGTAFGQTVNLFSQSFQDDGENTVIEVGFCGTDPGNVRVGQLCVDDLDCLSQPGETCQLGVVALSAKPEGDGDEIPDIDDNCPLDSNPGQEDADGDGFGDACDTFNCGDGIVQEAEACDEGPLNGMPGSSCSAQCTCGVNFEVTETLKPGANGNTPMVIFGSAAADGTGCLNLSNSTVGGVPPRSIDATTLRLSATQPTEQCPTTGGAPIHDMSKRYNSHLRDNNEDGIQDLRLHMDTLSIGGDGSTTMVYLTGEFTEGGGQFGETCFEAVAPVTVSGN